MSSASPSSASSRISRAAKRTKSDPNSPPAFVPSTSVFSFSRVLSDAGILLMGCSFVGRPSGKLSRQRFAIRRWCTPPRLSSNFRTSPAIIQQLGSGDRSLAVIELSKRHLGIGVDEGLLIDPADTLQSSDIESVLRTAIAWTFTIKVAVRLLLSLGTFQGLDLCFGQQQALLR